MKSFAHLVMGLVVAGLLGCSGNSSTDAAVTGELGLPDGVGTLWPCTNPGGDCEAHNSCVTSAVCGSDRLCHPAKMQNCDDGLSCTQDLCKGSGVCVNLPRAGTCALPVKTATGTEVRCFANDERNPSNPCQMCVAAGDAGSSTEWGPANSGPCDDQNGCSKNDRCQDGVCKGEDYTKDCADKYSCTEDLCDGKGGCLPDHKLRADWCLIKDVCVKDQQQDDDGCNQCEVKASQSTWTPLLVKCQIAGKCYRPGQKDTVGCASCDPTQNPSDWTPLPGVCRIDNTCSPSGTLHSQGCATCDPVANPNGWTVTGSNCLVGGACYKPGDKDVSGCLVCDPAKVKTDWSAVPDTCKIGSACRANGATDPTGCGVCDPTVSTTAWTVKGASCLIGTACYTQGQANTVGCGVCEPAQSKTSWSPPPNKCLVGKTCFASQDKDSTGCRLCDPSKNPGGWTSAAGVVSTTSTFEDGKTPPAGWTVVNNSSTIGWVVANRRAGQGSYSLYYGDPAAGVFEVLGGAPSAGTADLTLSLTAGKKAGLAFLIYLDTEAWLPLAPVFDVEVNGTVVWSRSPTFVMREWQEVVIDLSTYAGKSVTIRFNFNTNNSLLNFGEGVFVDDVTVYHNC